MILKKIYDEKTKTQKVWYESSMLVYSEMVESDTENVGDLYVTFKNGEKYKYKDVKFEDYVLFVGGGTDASQGKALGKFIKNKYEYEHVGKSSLDEIKTALEEANKEDSDIYNTYFISGHRDITKEEFEINYEPLINYALHKTENAKFVIGDYYGCDIMSQNYLIDVVGIDPSRVTVYHMFEKPRNINEKITNLVGGFESDEERDTAMTNASFEDIALVRDHKKLSGTGQNILRRYKLKSVSIL